MICFGAAAPVGVPLFFLVTVSLGTTTATLEVFLGHLIQNKFIRPKVCICQTNNLYSAPVRQSQPEQNSREYTRQLPAAARSGRNRQSLHQ
ncbi:MAG: PrgI family protein [Clostridiales bacterium]|nr:PrgI family protein [Clostridiales bacterium]